MLRACIQAKVLLPLCAAILGLMAWMNHVSETLDTRTHQVTQGIARQVRHAPLPPANYQPQ